MVQSVRSSGRWAVVAAVVTVVLWASAFVFIRSAGAEFSPGALALGRLLSASIVLVVILVSTGGGLPPRAAWRGILISGVLWFGVYMVALNWAEQHIDAGTAAMVINVGPVLMALLGGFILREGFPVRLMAGIAVSCTGAIVIGLSNSGGGSSGALGVLLCVLAATSWAISAIAQKPALAHASALQVTTFGCLIGTLLCLPFTGQLITEAAAAPLPATLSLIYLGVFPTALAFTTWAYALARTTAGKAGVTTYAVPTLVILMAWLALGEVPTLLAVAGGLLCLAGVAITRSGPKDPRTADAATEIESTTNPAATGASITSGSDPK
ncbi:DMT family transporter [Nocardia goodfellowii]|uniref:Drug/metabolite transporter (DMT)-like permease n=1 Tax=Nocardia goodfellowii TaxID=882446 RepID=A0ABS4QHA1_9NOCA|nr:DMT family transporter [Nocardia goodfellowii]MBP2190493.1 drug/metabolite transporter (DMT)-like permease [Nocardia goodfellowii]